jgi:DMSO/TMAO reductase YedYZ molybdopterin-dependent catalytic subunit
MTIQRTVVTQFPENSETPLEEMRSWVTPNAFFFVRNHFDEPDLSPSTWQLQIDGCVRSPQSLNWEALIALPERTVFATLECAGNGRSFLRKSEPGVQWGAGAVGHAEWTGVPLVSVLESCGPMSDALEVLCIGADCGTEPDHPETMQFARSLPMTKALHPDTVLAFRMNGEPLTRSHGAPVRLIVPGWYGVCSVKWVTRLELTRMAVKSELIRPRPGDELHPGVNRLSGIAWSGEDELAAVEVSMDGGRYWQRASLVGPQAPYSWTLWEYLWRVEQPGDYHLLCRATSVTGETQPTEHDPLCGGYRINFVRPRSVRVMSRGRSEETWGDAASRRQELVRRAEELTRQRLDIDMASEFMDGGGI